MDLGQTREYVSIAHALLASPPDEDGFVGLFWDG